MTRDKLKRFRWLAKEIRTLRAIIADLEEAVAPVASWDDLPNGEGCGDPVGELVAKKDELRARYVKALRERVELQREIEDWIDGLGERYKAIVWTMYVEGNTYLKTSEILGVCNETICKRLNECFDG